MSAFVSPSVRKRRCLDSKTLESLVFASYRRHVSGLEVGGVRVNEEWFVSLRSHGFRRVVLKGDMFYMCGNLGESVLDYIRRGSAENPETEFYFINDPARVEESTYLVVSGDDALKILAIGFLP